MAETIKKHFPKWNFYIQIAEFDNNLFIFENRKRSSCREYFFEKNEPWFIRTATFLKIWLEVIRK